MGCHFLKYYQCLYYRLKKHGTCNKSRMCTEKDQQIKLNSPPKFYVFAKIQKYYSR